LEGRAKIFAHYGQFYEVVPMDINIRAFGGELTTFSFINAGANGRPNDSCLLDLTTAEELAKCTRVPPANGVSGGGTQFAAPGMKPQYINESILGVEYELMSDFKLGATYTYRNLGRVIEDISTDGGASYLITNPSENFDDEAAKLDAQAKEQEMAGNDQLATLYTLRAEQLRLTKNYDKPVRDYHGVQFTATQRFSKNAFLLASYTYSFNRGNFPGLFSTETNQLDPNLTSLYDLPALVANRYGQLGLDRPHLLKLDGFYQFDFNAAGRVVVGAGIRGQSGVARNALGSSPYSGYGTGESYLLPRGSARRSPFTWQSDIRLTYGKKIGKTQSIEAFADVLNIFNSQAETRADENYTFDIANPIIGGSRDDLAHSKTLDEGGTEKNETPVKNPNYLVLTDRQDPLRFQFGMRYNF